MGIDSLLLQIHERDVMNVKRTMIILAIFVAGYASVQAIGWAPEESVAAFMADQDHPQYTVGTVRPPLRRAYPGILSSPRQDPLASNRAVQHLAPAASEVVKDVPSWLTNVPADRLID